MTLNFAKSAVVAAVLGFGAVAAQATTTTTDWLAHDPLEVGGAFKLVSGAFTDYFLFTLNPAGTVTSSSVLLNNAPAINITNASYSLWSGDGVGAGVDSLIASFPLTGSTGSTSNPVVLGAGSYFYKVEGTVAPNAAGIYSISSVLTPVPEPTTYALLLAGLGVVGFVASRRKPV